MEKINAFYVITYQLKEQRLLPVRRKSLCWCLITSFEDSGLNSNSGWPILVAAITFMFLFSTPCSKHSHLLLCGDPPRVYAPFHLEGHSKLLFSFPHQCLCTISDLKGHPCFACTFTELERCIVITWFWPG